MSKSSVAQLKVHGRLLQNGHAITRLFCSLVNCFGEKAVIIDSANISRDGTFSFLLPPKFPQGSIFKLTTELPHSFTFADNALYFTNERSDAINITIDCPRKLFAASLSGSLANKELSVLARMHAQMIKSFQGLAQRKVPAESTLLLAEIQQLHNELRQQLESCIQSSRGGAFLLLALYFYCSVNFLAVDNAGRLGYDGKWELPNTSLASAVVKELQSYPVK